MFYLIIENTPNEFLCALVSNLRQLFNCQQESLDPSRSSLCHLINPLCMTDIYEIVIESFPCCST